MRTHPRGPSWRAALWLRRQRVRGRSAFVWRWLVPRFALPAAFLATVARALTEPFRWPHFLLHVAVNLIGAGVLGGYIAGRLLWEMIVAVDGRGAAARRRE